MAFERPTLPDLVQRIQADFVSRLNLASALLRRAVVVVISRVIAGAAHMLHGHLAFLGQQLFPATSQDEFLLRQANLFGIMPDKATFAQATATATGVDSSPIDAGTVLVGPTGLEYAVDADVTIAAGVATISVTALEAGSDYTLDAAVVLQFESPVSGVDAAVTVVSSTLDGSDEEATPSVRERLIARMNAPPDGGDVADYVEWAREVAGVTRVWVVKLGLGPGTVLVRFVRDNDGTGSAIIPSGGEVAAVQAKFDELAPAHATPAAFAPTDDPLDMTMSLTPDNAGTRAAVTASLTDLLFRNASPGSTTTLSSLRTAIGDGLRAELGDDLGTYTLTVPAADTTRTAGQLGRLGTITFT